MKLSVQDLQALDLSERRHRTRFPIELGVHYTVEGHEAERAGRTVNISSCGLLITSADKLDLGASIRVVVEWPVLMDGMCPLALHIRGNVIRSEQKLVAVRFSSHELRTTGKSLRRVSIVEWLAKAVC
jgi:hypothetical protein